MSDFRTQNIRHFLEGGGRIFKNFDDLFEALFLGSLCCFHNFLSCIVFGHIFFGSRWPSKVVYFGTKK